MMDGEVDERGYARGQDTLSGINDVYRQLFRLPSRQDMHEISGNQFVPDQPIRQHRDTESVPHRFTHAGDTFGDQDWGDAQVLLLAFDVKNCDLICAPELRPG